MLRLSLVALLAVGSVLGACVRTTVTDTVYDGQGNLATGSVIITPIQQFQCAGGDQIYPTSITVQVVRGVFTVALAPTDTSLPMNVYYLVRWNLLNTITPTESWLVPTSGSPVGLATVRTTPVPPGILISPTQISQDGATVGQQITWLGTYWAPATDGAITLPFFQVSLLNFAAQTPGGTMTASTPATVSLAPCPLGVNGSDSHHWLYISGGTGTAEPVLITGGTCVSGVNGTIAFTPANNHSGAWTITSSAGGIPEALQLAATAGGGVAQLPPATGINVYAQISIPSNSCLVGQGQGSSLFLPNSQWADAPKWQFLGSGTGAMIAAYSGASAACIRNFTLDMNGINQTGISTNSSGGVFWNAPYGLIDSLTIRNAPFASPDTVIPIIGWTSDSGTIFSNNKIFNLASASPIFGAQGINDFGGQAKILFNLVVDGGAGAFGAGTNDLVDGNTYIANTSTPPAGSQLFFADSMSGAKLSNDTCISAGSSYGVCFSATTDNSTEADDNDFLNDTALNCAAGFEIKPISGAVRRTKIIGGYTNCATPLSFPNGTGSMDGLTVVGTGGIGSGDRLKSAAISSGTTQNLNVGDAVIYRTGTVSGNFAIGGIAGGFDGRELILINTSASTMTLNNADSGSTAGNRITTYTGSNVTLTQPNNIARLRYSAADATWFIEGTN